MISINRTLTALRDARKNDDKGFTLIELLVVILIIGVLAAIAIPIFLTQQTQAADAAIKADLANAKIAYVSALVNAPASTPDGAALTTNGYTGTNTIGITTKVGDAKVFCLSTGGWGITDSKGVAKGTCTAGVFTAS